MEDWLVDDDRLSIGRKSVLPGAGFFEPDSLVEAHEERDVKKRLSDVDTVVAADPDADGLASTALLTIAHDGVELVPTSPHEITTSLERIDRYSPESADIFVCDLCPDRRSDVEPLESLVANVSSVTWYDHHQWDDELRQFVEEAGVRLRVGPSGEVCTTDVVLEDLQFEFEERYHELARVTRDHDLWLREDERSDDLADYSYWVEPDEYLETILEHGADLPPDVLEFLAERRIEKDALVEKAVERAELRSVGDWTVGVTYGRCSQNEVAEALRQQGADAAVIVKPAGSASIRGTDRFERCHEVAGQVNGGGHPKAAGCKPDIYDDMLDYAHHWTTRGAVAKQAIIDAFRRLEPHGESGSETDG